jgi:dipeptidyl aminopeptidase/acylaminoacyl peptidase
MVSFDFDHYLRIPRLSGLRLSPDGRRLVVCVTRPDVEGKAFVSALWQVDPDAQRGPRRLTRSARGEGVGTFLRDGSLLFTSARPDEAATKDAREARGEAAGLWLLPADGGEARLLLGPAGGVDAVRAAAAADVLAFGINLDTRSTDIAGDAARAKARQDAGVAALLFESFPIRYWDRYLGPRERHLLSAELPAGPDEAEGPLRAMADLLPEPGQRLLEVDVDLVPDGSAVVCGLVDEAVLTRPQVDLVLIDRASGTRRVLAAADGTWHTDVRCSPDGRWAVCIRSVLGDLEHAEQNSVWLVDLASGAGRPLSAGLLDVWAHELAWSPDSSAVFVAGDRVGRVPVYRVEVATGATTRLTDDGAYVDLQPTPDGSGLFALCSSYLRPPHPVWLDAQMPDQAPRELAFAGLSEAEVAVPGVLERLECTAADGVRVPSWLVRPAGASAEQPAPLVVFIHGGPLGSWNGWHWRWNPQLLVARGYAVLLVDPAISTGYGQAYVDRGWGRWGEAPYNDVMAATDSALTRADLDATRTAAMGGSFGG